nr:RNA-directed DNA polymerase, eukaryota [Tanacetum cinerariifolium]
MVMHFMGFNEKWISWIKGCLSHATASILVNGSPTREYHINRGLRQGDPLSPFLFIIAMEGLHVAIEDAICAGLYRGLTINTLTLSHFFFADDALLIECFHRVSGLKINLHKSNLVGIGVSFDEVKILSQITGCNATRSSFKYLGLPVDCNMAISKSWDPLIEKFSKRLSKWKASLLTYYCSLFPMPASKDKGGLGIGSLFSLNHALIQKWRWRFFQNPNALWVQVIKAIHGDYGTDFSFYSHVREHSVWGRIVNSINSMHEKEFIPLSFLRKKVGDGLSTKFWHDVWICDSSLQSKFSRLYRIASNKDCTVRDVWNNGWDFSWSRPILGGTILHQLNTFSSTLEVVTLSDSKDIWTWSIGSPSFSVKCTREHIDKRYLPDGDSETRWNRSLPKKINIFIWKALRDRLPTRWNLSRKGIELDTLLCPICDSNIETVDHTFWTCSLATSIWNKIFDWLDIDAPSPVHIKDIFTWINDLRVSTTKKSILEVICGVALWALWQFRKGLVFGSSPSNRCTLFDSIIDTSYRWYSIRNKLSSISWNNWMLNPLL